MFQSAYEQISEAEQTFVDRLVSELHRAAKRHGRSIRLALQTPLPEAIRERDIRGFLERPLVRAAIQSKVMDIAVSDDITLDKTAREIHAIAHAKISDFYDVDEVGDPVVNMDAVLDPEKSAAIKSIEFEKSDGLSRTSKTKVKMTMHDKIAALKMEMQLMGVDDGDSPYRKSERTNSTKRITDETSAQQASDAWQRMMGE